MLQQKQLTHTSCLQACIANILELPIEQVPDFSQFRGGMEGTDYPMFWIEMQSWLRNRGFLYVEVPKVAIECPQCNTKGVVLSWMPIPFKFDCFIIGTTVNGSKHIINGCVDETRIIGVFDPLTGGVDEASMSIFPSQDSILAFAFLVPIHPHAMVSTWKPQSLIIGEN